MTKEGLQKKDHFIIFSRIIENGKISKSGNPHNWKQVKKSQKTVQMEGNEFSEKTNFPVHSEESPQMGLDTKLTKASQNQRFRQVPFSWFSRKTRNTHQV